jgi:hypothetical protein
MMVPMSISLLGNVPTRRLEYCLICQLKETLMTLLSALIYYPPPLPKSRWVPYILAWPHRDLRKGGIVDLLHCASKEVVKLKPIVPPGGSDFVDE